MRLICTTVGREVYLKQRAAHLASLGSWPSKTPGRKVSVTRVGEGNQENPGTWWSCNEHSKVIIVVSVCAC